MTTDREPDETRTIRLEEGYDIVTYSFGQGDEVLFCVNGGPGVACDYIRDSHSILADHGLRVVAFDQLGCGRSDRPDDPSLWTIERYVRETEQVRQALGLGKVHFYGQSWGTWLGIEYCLAHPEALRSVILSNGACNIPHLVTELERLRQALGPETVAMMQRHEAENTLDHPAYKGAIAILDHRHVCRLDVWPDPLKRSVEGLNMGPYGTMQGPNEFCYTGNLKDWNREPDLHRIAVPALVIVGAHDELTPACAMRIASGLPNSELAVLQNSSHTPFFEEPEAYFRILRDFLERQRATGQ